ncbi:Bystin, putative [Hepatocystis sp. ex Piliocolobus tephrosceles]|nr:Bystin, putative [Hepatocystis sp. ex Piliocolobus tephrosceles]
MSVAINVVVDVMEKMYTFAWNAKISYILEIFLNKKYNFVKEVIDKCVNYFLTFANYFKPLTVNWHISLLSLVKNYRNLIDDNQIDQLRKLLKTKPSNKITNDILKHMYSSTSFIDKIKQIATNTNNDIV